MRLRAAIATLGALLVPVPALAAEAAGAAADDVGFPQVRQIDTFAGQVFWLAVCFALLYVLMARLALPRVAETLETRQAKRRENLNRAEACSEEAAKVKKSFEASLAKAQGSAQELLTSAGQDISEKVAAENAKFAETSRKRLLSAEQGVQKAKQEALASLADISAEIAAEMAAKVANVQVSKADAKTAVAALMKG